VLTADSSGADSSGVDSSNVDSLTIESFAKDLGSYLEPQQIDLVVKAYHFADEAHKGQKRKSGEPYITHPLAVAGILADMHMDHQCLMAALLHDVIEDTGIPKLTLGQEFDDEVAELVDGVSKLNNMFHSRAEAQAENFQKMTLAMGKDIRVILVKLADRLHNMRTLGHLDGDRRRRIAKETLEIYAPIALRLGMNTIRVEFEELGFRAMYPMRSSMIEKAVKRARGNRTEIVSNIRESIAPCLEREGISAMVFGREKHLYSIYDKMRSKRKSFNEIMDVYAFRILVDSVDNCYRSLGAVHNLYKPVAGRFKDYIAIPKANGYQSLHTTLFGMHGIPIEIQIRTHDMETVANNGIAGHYLYKTNEESTTGSHERAREWMKGLLELQQSAGNSLEFIENVKIDLFPDEVYVFSPVGEIFDLPQGATPIDFAYAVHTDIGNSCVACRIDRRLAPLSANLESGQTVEIIRAPGAQPNPAWLGFVVTGKARASIRHALKQQQTHESTILGRRLLERALERHDLTIEEIDPTTLALVLEERKIDNLDKLLAEIGLGNQMANIIVKRLLGDSEEFESSAGSAPLAIKGTEGLVVAYARCCRPIPGDPIIGHVSAGRGIVIHTDNCKNMIDLRGKPEELIDVRWEPNVDQEFSVELRVELEHERGIIAVVASTVTSANANIERINMMEKDAHLGIVNMVLSVHDRVHLANVIRRVRTIKGISRIVRVRS
jgi:RelA/SpoT family (p)ppGpp synthetase